MVSLCNVVKSQAIKTIPSYCIKIIIHMYQKPAYPSFSVTKTTGTIISGAGSKNYELERPPYRTNKERFRSAGQDRETGTDLKGQCVKLVCSTFDILIER